MSVIVLSVKNKNKNDLIENTKEEIEDCRIQLDAANNRCSEYNNSLILKQSEVTKLKSIVKEQTNRLEEYKTSNESMSIELSSLKSELETMKEFKKRSDAARKGAQTRKKNKELQAQQLNEAE